MWHKDPIADEEFARSRLIKDLRAILALILIVILNFSFEIGDHVRVPRDPADLRVPRDPANIQPGSALSIP